MMTALLSQVCPVHTTAAVYRFAHAYEAALPFSRLFPVV